MEPPEVVIERVGWPERAARFGCGFAGGVAIGFLVWLAIVFVKA